MVSFAEFAGQEAAGRGQSYGPLGHSASTAGVPQEVVRHFSSEGVVFAGRHTHRDAAAGRVI